MTRTHGTYQLGREVKGTLQGTGISLNQLIEKTKTMELSGLLQYQKALNSYPMPISVRKEINIIVAKRLMGIVQ